MTSEMSVPPERDSGEGGPAEPVDLDEVLASAADVYDDVRRMAAELAQLRAKVAELQADNDEGQPTRPDESLDVFGARWERHVMADHRDCDCEPCSW